jgi:hypothetical protein
MFTLHIEHPIRNFDIWKAAFERDPIGRERSGVRHHRIMQPIDDPNYVMIDLDFATVQEAEAVLAALRQVWQSPAAAPALGGSPQTRIVEVMESTSYEPAK